MIGGTGSQASCPVSHSVRPRRLLLAIEERWISVQKSSSVTSASYPVPCRTSAIGQTPL
jgi:hypothetical protein